MAEVRKEGVSLVTHIQTLAQIAVGQNAVITALRAPVEERNRLLALGFVPGGCVRAVQASPWGDPVAYDVCGAVIALRQTDARKICVASAPFSG